MPSPAERGRIYAVVVHGVLAADLFNITCGLGPGCGRHRLHLTRVTTPRPGTPAGDDALQWVQRWVATHTGAVPPAVFMTVVRPARYGWRPTHHGRIHAPDGAALDVDLVAAGHATWR